jgi:hypothetical protein
MRDSKSINQRNSNPNPVEIPLKDSLFLSPIEKYKIYGRFPWKLIIHILLVIATTSQVKIIKIGYTYNICYNSIYKSTRETIL